MKKHIVRSIVVVVVTSACWFGLEIGWEVARAAGPNGDLETISGSLEVIADCEENGGQTLYFINTDTERLRVKFVSEANAGVLDGEHVTLEGVRTGDEFRADEKSLTRLSNEPEGPQGILPGTVGGIRVLVLLVNFQDNQSQPFTTAYAHDLMFNESNAASVTKYYRESSYGQTWIQGNSAGWFTLPMNANCDANTQIATYAQQAAVTAGFNLSNYDKYMYVYPNIGCTYSGRGTVGGQNSWIHASMVLRTAAHELGHNLGLFHSKALDCGDVVIGPDCTTVEYGHPADMLGQPGVTGHFHPYQKERLGWLNYGAAPPLTTVESSGSYTITASSEHGGSPKGLKVLRSIDALGRKTWYYVEFRRPVGFDSFVSTNPSMMNGVVVTMDNETLGAENFVLDMTPTTNGFSDAALQVGQSFMDPPINLIITPTAVGASGATVYISLTPCTMASPGIAVGPSTIQQLAPGTAITYSVSVTNNNSGGCTSNDFNVQGTVPSGWTATAGSPVLQVPPGATVSTTVQVAVPAGAVDGMYSVSMIAANQSAPAYSISSVNYISVVTPSQCSLAEPTVTVSPAVTQWQRPATFISYSVTVNNNNSSGCTANGFNIQVAMPANWTAGVTSPVLQVAPGASQTTSVRLNIPAGDPGGFYNPVFTATNSTSPGHSASVIRTVAVYTSLGVNVATDQAFYTRTQTVVITANVTALGNPMAGAAVTFTITKPGGKRVTASAVSDASGRAVYNFKFNKGDKLGTYTAAAAASLNGASGTGSATFVLR